MTDAADTVIGSGTVTNDLDSGGVYGTIPSSIAGSGSLQGDTISVYDGNTLLYSYSVGHGQPRPEQAPTVISGSAIDSGVVPFIHHEAYFDYATDKTYWGPLVGRIAPVQTGQSQAGKVWAMELALQITLVVTSILVVLLVLLHRAKGGGLSTLFGGGVQSSLSGSTVVEKNLDRLTLFVVGIWLVAIVGMALRIKYNA